MVFLASTVVSDGGQTMPCNSGERRGLRQLSDGASRRRGPYMRAQNGTGSSLQTRASEHPARSGRTLALPKKDCIGLTPPKIGMQVALG
jgi:hypothetical protein